MRKTRAQSTSGPKTYVRSLLFIAYQLAEGFAQQRGGVGAEAVYFAIRCRIAAIGKWRLFIPNSLGNDVADLVVGQADEHVVRAGELFVDGRLNRGIGEIGALGRGVRYLVEN